MVTKTDTAHVKLKKYPAAQLLLDDLHTCYNIDKRRVFDRFKYACCAEVELGLSQNIIENALGLLESLGLIQYENEYSRSNDNFRLTPAAYNFLSPYIKRGEHFKREKYGI